MEIPVNRLLFLVGLVLFFLPTSVFAATLAKPANTLGLVGYWSFDEGTTTIAADHSGNKNTGTLSAFVSAKPTWVSGKHGKALNFDGSSAYVSVPNSSSLNITGSITISTWIKPSSVSTDQKVIGKQDTNNGYKMTLFGTGKVEFELDNGGTASNNRSVSGGTVLTAGQWYHVVDVYDSSANMIYTYINGNLDRSLSVGASPLGATTAALEFGAAVKDGSSNLYSGALDDVRIYSRALSPGDILNLYKSGEVHVSKTQTAVASGLLSWWTFDGATIGTTIQDYTGQGNNVYVGGGVSTSSVLIRGKIGQAVNFNGSSSYLTSPSSNLNIGGTFTIGGWIRATQARGDFREIISKGNKVTGHFEVYLQNGTGELRFYSPDINSNVAVTSGYIIDDGKWHNFNITYDGATMTFYVDGVSVATRSVTGTVSSQTMVLDIGKQADTSGSSMFFNGSIDDLRVYNRALSAPEVQQIYLEGAGNKMAVDTTGESSLVSGLVGYWSFNGNNVSDKVYDQSGNGNNGYTDGSVATSAMKTIGKVGQALNFNGTSNYVAVTSNSNLPVGNSNYTIAAWIKPSALGGYGGIVGWGNYGSSNQVNALRLTESTSCAGGQGIFNYWWANDISDCTALLTAGKWHLVVAEFDGTTRSLYLDGTFLKSDTPGGSHNVTTSSNFKIGETCPLSTCAADAGEYFPGGIDEVRIYNRALTASEITQLYLAGK
jgi:hypothetical protein